MAKPNTTFNLDVKDIELIEDALHSVIAKRSNDLITAGEAQNSTVDRASAEAEMSEMARSFYTAQRRIRSQIIGPELGLELFYPDYESGLKAILAAEQG